MASASLRRLVRQRYRAVVIWAMVPLALLNGRTVSGCTCADGRYGPCCHAGLGLDGDNTGKESPATACCGSSCCTRPEAKPGCCHASTACCRHSVARHDSDGKDNGVNGKCCCTRIVQTQAIPAVVTTPPLGDDHPLPAAFTVVGDSLRVRSSVRLIRATEIDTGPPPDDLVVAFQRFVI